MQTKLASCRCTATAPAVPSQVLAAAATHLTRNACHVHVSQPLQLQRTWTRFCTRARAALASAPVVHILPC